MDVFEVGEVGELELEVELVPAPEPESEPEPISEPELEVAEVGMAVPNAADEAAGTRGSC